MKRRRINQALLSLPLALSSQFSLARSGGENVISKGSSPLSPIGMGTWITFDHQPSSTDTAQFVAILKAFFAAGGQMIDSSPMYGYAQQLLGVVLPQVNHNSLFAATKVWTPGKQLGIEQMQTSMGLWGLETMDLMLVHNLMDWQSHLPTLRRWQEEGKIHNYGVTTSHGRRHRELISIMQHQALDYVQFTYNIFDREAEQYLLPLAVDKGIKVVINRPFQGGGLFARVHNKKLPDWAQEIKCQSWSQFFLKFIISHPAVSCAIPATSQVEHMKENMRALQGPMPNKDMRTEMIKYFKTIA